MSGKRTAIGRHLEYLAHHWSKIQGPFDKIVFMSPSQLRTENLGTATPIELRSFGRSLPNLLWEQGALPYAARNAAVLFSEYTCPLLFCGPIVVANHGIYEGMPGAFSMWQRLRAVPLSCLSARRANRVIANSFSTRADLVHHFRVSEFKIDVIYPAPAEFFFEPHTEESINAEIVALFGARFPYILFVGKLSTRRHVPNLMEAFAIVRRRESLPHHLLVVGPNVNQLPLEHLAQHHGITPFFTYVPHMEQPALAKIYAGADLFVLPSIYEGISWTIFEAMASRSPVLAVDHPTLVESAGGAVMTVPTPGVDDLVRGITALLTNPELKEHYRGRGRSLVETFSLAESARATLEIIHRTARDSDQAR